MHTFVVGASAGGVEALRALVAQLPSDFPGVVLVVLHVAPLGTSVLPQILERAGDLPVSHAVHDQAVEPGHVYVAPPDQHLLVLDGHLRLDRGPRVNGHRPAIDTLFQSAARMYGSGVAGVVLSGVLDDGAAGLMAIKRAGGITLVQDPSEALYEMMPQSAIDLVHPDRVASAADLGAAIAGLAEAPPEPPVDEVATPALFVDVDRAASDDPQRGDAGRADSALWTALRVLEERAALHRRMAGRQRGRGHGELAERYEWRANEAVEQAVVLRRRLAALEPAERSGAA